MENLEQAFTLCAIAGGTVFIIRLILQFFVGIDDADVDADGFDGEPHGDHSDLDFKFLSVQGVSSFLMMFGLVGRAMIVDSETSAIPAIIAAIAAGFGSLWVLALLFKFMGGMQSSGNLDKNKAIGAEGSVYLTIPASGTGQVTITVNNQLKVMDAVSDSTDPLPTGTDIKVIRITGDGVLVVEEVQ